MRPRRYPHTVSIPLTQETIDNADQFITANITRSHILRLAIVLGLKLLKEEYPDPEQLDLLARISKL